MHLGFPNPGPIFVTTSDFLLYPRFSWILMTVNALYQRFFKASRTLYPPPSVQSSSELITSSCDYSKSHLGSRRSQGSLRFLPSFLRPPPPRHPSGSAERKNPRRFPGKDQGREPREDIAFYLLAGARNYSNKM